MQQKIFEGTEQEFLKYMNSRGLKLPQAKPFAFYISDDIKEKPANVDVANVKNPQLKKFLTGIQSFGGLTHEDTQAMKKHSQSFRNEFQLDK